VLRSTINQSIIRSTG